MKTGTGKFSVFKVGRGAPGRLMPGAPEIPLYHTRQLFVK